MTFRIFLFAVVNCHDSSIEQDDKMWAYASGILFDPLGQSWRLALVRSSCLLCSKLKNLTCLHKCLICRKSVMSVCKQGVLSWENRLQRARVSSINIRKNTREKRNPFAFLKAVGKEIHLVIICQKRCTPKKVHTRKAVCWGVFCFVIGFVVVGGGVLFLFF